MYSSVYLTFSTPITKLYNYAEIVYCFIYIYILHVHVMLYISYRVMYFSYIFCSPTQKKVTPAISVIGLPKYTKLDEGIMNIVQQRFNIEGGVAEVYQKAVVHNQLIFSKLAKRVKKRNSYTILYTDPQAPDDVRYGRVEAFIICPVDYIHLAVIEPLKVSSCDGLVVIPPEMASLSSFFLQTLYPF